MSTDDAKQRQCANPACSMRNMSVKTDRSHCLGCDRKLQLVGFDQLSDDLLSGFFGNGFGR